MQAIATFLLVLTYLSTSHGWTCTVAPQQINAAQIDAGQGQVALTDINSNVFFLNGSSWYRLGSVPLKHVSVGAAGIWGVDSSNKVYKYVASDFISSQGLDLQQVDAGGQGNVVGVSASSGIHCLQSSIASTYKQVGTLSWNTIPGGLQYISCGPQNECWGINSGQQIYFTNILPTNCSHSGWKQVGGAAKMVEVGADGSVFVVNSSGNFYQRTGISSSVPEGTGWTQIPMCTLVDHLSYDLGNLWIVSKCGVVFKCIS